MTIANGKVSESMEEEFFIRSRPPPLEENLISKIAQKNPIENVEYGKLGGGCLSKPRYIEVHLKIPKSLYKQGEKVDIWLLKCHFLFRYMKNCLFDFFLGNNLLIQ